MKKYSLRNDSFIYGLAVMAERLISFFILPILTKTLPTESYGVWTQILITSSLVGNLVLFGFTTAAVKFLAGRDDNAEISSIFHRMFALVGLNALLVLLLSWWFMEPLGAAMFGHIRFAPFAVLFGFYVAIEALYEILIALLRSLRKISRVSSYYFLKNLVRVGALATGILILDMTLYQSLLLLIGINLVFIAYMYVVEVWLGIGVSFKRTELRFREVVLYSLPLLPYAVMIWVNNFVNRYFIVHILDMESLSVFSVAYSLAGIVGIAYMVLGFTLFPHMASLWNRGDKEGASAILSKAAAYYMFFALPVVAALSMLQAPVVELLSTAGFVTSPYVIFWLCLGIFVFGFYQLNIYPVMLAGRTGLNLVVTSISLFIGILLNVILIPMLGLVGAALATFISSAILAAWTTVYCRRSINYRFPWRAAARTGSATAVMILFLWLAGRFVDLGNLYLLLLTCIIASVIYISIDLMGGDRSLLRNLKGTR